MAVSVTGPRAVNELGGPVIPGTHADECKFPAVYELRYVTTDFKNLK